MINEKDMIGIQSLFTEEAESLQLTETQIGIFSIVVKEFQFLPLINAPNAHKIAFNINDV